MAWDISTLTYDNKSCDISGQTIIPTRVNFNLDGTKMYVAETFSPLDTILQYTLSTAWDVSTASYSGKSYDVSAQGNEIYGMFFKPDGKKLYVLDDGWDSVWQHSLSTAWDISTASYDNKFYPAYGGYGELHPRGLFFNSDGTLMYVGGQDNKRIYQHILLTAWDISTASYNNKYGYVGTEIGATLFYSIFLNPLGNKVYLLTHYGIFQYSLSVDWDISTLTYDNKYKNITEDNLFYDLFIRSNSVKLYAVGAQNEKVYQYSIAVSAGITTEPATSIWDNYCLANANITDSGGYNIIERGFEYGYEEEALWCIRETGTSLDTGAFIMKIDGLTPETTYHYRSFFTTFEEGEVYGEWVEFTTTILHQPNYDIYTEPFTGSYRLYVSDDEAIAWGGYKGPFTGKQNRIYITDITNKTKGVKILKLVPTARGTFHVCITVQQYLKS